MTRLAKSEHKRRDAALQSRVEAVLDDWSDDNWLQFSTWDLHHIKAYIYRSLTLKEEA